MAMSTANTDPQNRSSIPDQEMKHLIAKHRVQIDSVLILDTPRQMQAVAQLGIDPVALEDHYKDLVQRNERLATLDSAATRKTSITGWLSAAAGATVAFTFRKRIAESKLVQGFTTALAGLAAGLVGTFTGSRLFSGRIRDEGKELAIESRGALERELAVAFENREREAAASQSASGNAASKVAPRNASYAAQATADKATAAGAAQQRA